MGSDAPVAPLDPWLAISAAVFGTESSDREPFQPEQCLDFETALASSTAVGRVALRDAGRTNRLNENRYVWQIPRCWKSQNRYMWQT